jgi:transcriptional regulator with XRE-family HTH domain
MRVKQGQEPIAPRLRSWRAAQRKSASEAATLLGTSRSQWSQWENGLAQPGIHWRRRILVLIDGGQDAEGAPLSRALVQFRTTHALSQAEAARRFGCGKRTWQAWEAGARRPNKQRQMAIWRFLDGFS